MFSLIIQVISIALAAAFVIGTLYYGGTMFSEGTVRANASAVVNQGQQLAGSVTLYAANNAGVVPTSLSTLETDNYLQTIPNPPKINSGTVLDKDDWTIDTTNNLIMLSGIDNVAVCTAINSNVGQTSTADGVLLAGHTGTSPNQIIDTVPYGCVGAAGALKFQFKF